MASRFWVGGTGTWDTSSTTHWSATSGGASGASAPTTADTVTIDANSGSGTITTASGATCSTCTLNSSNIGLTLGAAQTITGAFTLTLGTLSLGSYKLTCATFASSNTNTRTIAFGTGNIEVNSTGTVWDTSTITNLTTTGTQVVNVTNSGSTAISILPGALSESNSISFNVTAGTYAVTLGTGSYRNLDFTGFGGTIGNAARTIYGNITLSSTSGNFGTALNILTFAGTGNTQTITSNGTGIGNQIVINKSSGTVKLNDALIQSAGNGTSVGITLTSGIFDANNFNVTCTKFASNNSNTRTLTMGSGTWTITAGVNGTLAAWDISTTTGLTFNKNTANIILIANKPAATANNIFTGGGLTYNDLTISGTTTPANVQFTGANTFANLSNVSDRTISRTYIFPASTTTTVSTWNISNTSGTATLKSSTAGTRFTVSQASGTVNVSNCTIQDSAATGGATWNAYTTNNNVDAGNNTGWIFTAPVTNSMLIMF